MTQDGRELREEAGPQEADAPWVEIQQGEDTCEGGEAFTQAQESPAATENVEAAAQVQALQERYLRLLADFDNYRKRTRREQEEFLSYAVEGLLNKLLPVLDSLDRALAAGGQAEDAGWKEGVRLIRGQFWGVLEGEGLQAMEALGKSFDPHFHHAVVRECSSVEDEGKVLAELQKGYLYKGKILRPALVRVAGSTEEV